MFRRKRLPEHLLDAHRAFLATASSVDRARRLVADAAPTTRFAGRPLPDVLFDFETALREARGDMGGWRPSELQEQWAACDAGIEEALALAERLRIEAPELRGFEALIGALERLLAPLDAFEGAAERFGNLRSSEL